MQRQLGDERARYGRKTFRERLDDAFDWPASHRPATAIILIIVVGAALLYLATGRAVDQHDLAIGDCLYVPTEAAKDPTATRPIGDAGSVEDVFVHQGAEHAECTASHGHEVSAIVTGPEPSNPGETGIGTSLDLDAIHRLTAPLCEAAFAGYVGHALSGSMYVTFPVVPDAPTWIADGRRTICLVARADGQWMDHTARGSGG